MRSGDGGLAFFAAANAKRNSVSSEVKDAQRLCDHSSRIPRRRCRALLEKQTLFEANSGGYAIYRIPGIVATDKGTLIAYCEARKTGTSDWAPST